MHFVCVLLVLCARSMLTKFILQGTAKEILQIEKGYICDYAYGNVVELLLCHKPSLKMLTLPN